MREGVGLGVGEGEGSSMCVCVRMRVRVRVKVGVRVRMRVKDGCVCAREWVGAICTLILTSAWFQLNYEGSKCGKGCQVRE